MNLIDRTGETRGITESRQRSRRTGEFIPIFRGARTREPGDIDSIVLHQTSFSQSARGNRIDRYDHTIAHFVVLPNGTVLQLRALETRLNSIAADNGIHIEFVGLFYDDRFTCRMLRRRRSRRELPTISQIHDGRELLTYLRSLEPIRGQLRYILAHRQITTMGSDRDNCPGPHIWYNLGKWAVDTLGMSSARSEARPIPPSWEDPRFQIPPPCDPPDSGRLAARGQPLPRPEGVSAYGFRKPRPEGLDFYPDDEFEIF